MKKRGKSKRRWTAFDSLPRRKYPVDGSCFKEESTHSETIRRPDCGNSEVIEDLTSRLDTKRRMGGTGRVRGYLQEI